MQLEGSSLLSIPVAFFDAFTFALFFKRFLGKKYNSRRPYILAYILYFVLNVNLSVFYMDILAAFSVISCFIIAYTLYNGTRTQRIFCGGLLTAYLFVSETVTMLVISFSIGYTLTEIAANTLLFYTGAFVAKAIALCLALFISSNRAKPLNPVPFYYHLLLLVITYISVGLSYAVFFFVSQSDASATIFHVFAEIAVVVLSILVFFVFEKLQKYAEQETYTTVIEQQLSHNERRFNLIDSQITEIRGLKHDLTNHLICIRRLSADKQYDKLNDYLDEYLPKTSEVITNSYTGKPSVDSILSEKVAAAEYGNIEVKLNVNVLPEFSYSPVHLNIILGNALDNAIEACYKLPEDRVRYISLDLKIEEGWLYIRIVNSSVPVKITAGGFPLTDKTDNAHHGLGLNIVNQLVHRNDGIMHCKYEDGDFILLVRIKIASDGYAL